MNDRAVPRPDRRLAFAEGPRVLSEIASLMPAAPFLLQAPRGDGHAVLVMPGLGGGDGSTTVLRGFLSSMGYRSYPWHLGTNQVADRFRERAFSILVVFGNHRSVQVEQHAVDG